jgi:hypothetical protein
MRGTLDGTLVVVLKQGAHSELLRTSIRAVLATDPRTHDIYLKSQCRKPANLTFAIDDEFFWFFVAMFALRSSLIAFP